MRHRNRLIGIAEINSDVQALVDHCSMDNIVVCREDSGKISLMVAGTARTPREKGEEHHLAT